MTLRVSVRPLSPTVYLHGTPDAATFYSLSGTVELSVDPSPVPTSLLLTSLVIKFVGRSQHTQHEKDALLNPLQGKDRLTLCSITQELVNEPALLDFTDASYPANSTRYSVVFDLHSIPGWLPPSAVAKHTISHDDEFGDVLACSETTYGLTAHATYKIVETALDSRYSLQDDGAGGSDGIACILNACNPLSTLSTAFGSTSRLHGSGPAYSVLQSQDTEASLPVHTATDLVPITVTRLLVPLSLISTPTPLQAHGPPPPTTKYTITAHSTPSSPIPDKLCSRLQLVVSTPSFISTLDDNLGFVVKMRLKPQEGESSDAGTLTVSHVDIDVEEHATFRTRPEDVFVTCARESGGARTTSEPTPESSSSDSPTEQTSSRWWSSAIRALSSSFSSRLVAASDCPSPNTRQAQHRRSTSNSHTLEEAKWRVVRSLLHEDSASSFWLDENETPESSEEDEDDEELPVKHAHALGQDGSWSTIRLNLKLTNSSSTTDQPEGKPFVDYSSDPTSQRTIAPSYHGPYARVAHLLRISAHVGYKSADGTVDEHMKDVVQFELPLQFVVRPPTRTCNESLSTMNTSSQPLSIRTCVESYAPNTMPSLSLGSSVAHTTTHDSPSLVLPAYSQIFDQDGEPRMDAMRGVPPPYCPAPSNTRSANQASLGSRPAIAVANAEGGSTILEDGVLVTKPELVPIGTAVLSWQHIKSLIET